MSSPPLERGPNDDKDIVGEEHTLKNDSSFTGSDITREQELLAMLSHDLRSPLSGILGFLGLLEGTTLNAEQRGYLATAVDCAAGLHETLEGFLDYTEVDTGRIVLREEPTNLLSLLHRTTEVFRLRAIRNGFELKLKIPQNMPAWWILDRVKLRQILFNLLDNAIKFTNTGWVALEIEKIRTELGDCKTLRLTIKDSGIGIPRDQLERIFDPFYQGNNCSHKKHSGYGLGLAIVKKLVPALNGQLKIDSELNHGTTVTIDFFWQESCPPV